jgi:pyruvate/2-oxoglutarate dehydrogenase complex dihydrolipoamide acyltransferase (E2) component
VSLPPTPTTPAYLSPAARHLVESQSLDISTLHGTARGARRIISKEDVVNALQSGTIRTATTTGAAAAVTVATTTTTHSSAAPLTAPQSQQTTNLSSSAATIGDGIGGRYTDVPNSNMRKVSAS